MDTKLTLKLDKEIIQKSKIYAKERGISLSRLIESQLKALTDYSEKKEENYLPEVNNLIGVLERKEETS
jgi:hypothetical protein